MAQCSSCQEDFRPESPYLHRCPDCQHWMWEKLEIREYYKDKEAEYLQDDYEHEEDVSNVPQN